MRGHYVEEITDDLKERFLDLIADGFTRQEAAKAVGSTPRQFRALCSPKSHRYDEEFARQYAKLTEKDGEHQDGLVERLETAAIERAIRSSDPLLTKLLTIHSKDWAIHRPQAMQLNFNADKMQLLFPNLSTETLEQMKRDLEQKRMGELPPGPPDIDMTP